MDVFEALLADDFQKPESRPAEPWKWTRLGTEIGCKGLFTKELREVRKRATRTTFDPKTHERQETFDQDLFNDELILACTGKTFTDKAVRDHYGVEEAREAMLLALRDPDDFSDLLMHCMKLCGLTADEEQKVEEETKNG